MLATLILGYFYLMLYSLILILLSILLFIRFKAKQRKEMGAVKILRNLSKIKFSQVLFKAEEECIICWNAYNPEDEVVRLKCNDKHFFHSVCIENWIKAGNNSCPLCRQPINKEVHI